MGTQGIAAEDHLALEPLLIARLKAEVPGFRDVLCAADLASIQESSQSTPAAHVVLDSDGFPDTESGKKMTRIEQVWVVMVTVRNVRDTLGGADTRKDAGPLIKAVHKALSGWHPSPEDKPLVRVKPPYKSGFNAGFGYFPMAFRFTFYAEGASCESN